MNKQAEKQEQQFRFREQEALPDNTRVKPFIRLTFSPEIKEEAKSFLKTQGFKEERLEGWFSDTRLELLSYPKPINGSKAKIKKGQAKSDVEAEYGKYKNEHDFWLLVPAGRLLLAHHSEAFESAERETGVKKELIAATLGIEGKYGISPKRYQVFSLLMTYLQNRPDKEEFAKNELADFLRICIKYNADPFSIMGSSAGAIFPGQFLPSTIRQVDDLPKGSSFDQLASFSQSIRMVAKMLKKLGATAEEGFQVGGKNYKAAFGYNHDENYARFVMELSDSLKSK